MLFQTPCSSPQALLSTLILFLAAFYWSPVHAQITASTTPLGGGSPSGAPQSSSVLTRTDPFIIPPTTAGPSATRPPTGTTTYAPAPPTVYTYTTVDAQGNTQVLSDTYTPTYMSTVTSFSRASGTIWNYSDYTSKFATATKSSATPRTIVSTAIIWQGALSLTALLLGSMLLL